MEKAGAGTAHLAAEVSALRRGRKPRPEQPKPDALHTGDARFDDWEVVRDFEDLDSARAWRQHLAEAGIEAVITSDWPLDRFGRGDIAVRVPPGSWSEAEEFLSELDED
jgi:hypothetical protein